MKLIILPRRTNTVFDTYPEYPNEVYDKFVSPYSFKEYKSQGYSVFAITDMGDEVYKQYLYDHYAYTTLINFYVMGALIADYDDEVLRDAFSHSLDMAIVYTAKTNNFNEFVFNNADFRKEQYHGYFLYVALCAPKRYEQFEIEVNDILQNVDLTAFDKTVIYVYNSRFSESTIKLPDFDVDRQFIDFLNNTKK